MRMAVVHSSIRTIGIPQSLFYYKHPGLWETFFSRLGFSVVLSGHTTASMLEAGARRADSESCVSCKIFTGHCAALIDSQVDALLIPRYLSMRKGFVSCPRLYAMDNTISHEFDYTPRIISPCVDMNRHSLYVTLLTTGFSLTSNIFRITRAIAAAKTTMRELTDAGSKQYRAISASARFRFLLVGHPYVLHDRFANHDIHGTLLDLGVTGLPVDQIPLGNSDHCYSQGWEFMDDILRRTATAYSDGIHGVLQLSTFNCGCDSVMKVLLEHQCRSFGVPYMPLVFDEHSSDAAIRTRVEAFIDSVC
jgi:predicted nucleotide-binding protein (sugar kinase/HSP70/actin superfamily)